MQESDDSNSAAEGADTEKKEEQSDVEDNEEVEKKKEKETKASDDSGDLLVMESESVDIDAKEPDQVVVSDHGEQLEATTVEEVPGVPSVQDEPEAPEVEEVPEVTEVTAESELNTESFSEDEKDEKDEKDEEDEEAEREEKGEESSTTISTVDETEISLTDDIGDSDDVSKDDSSFLELDTETRHKMDEIEETERLAEEAEKAAEEEAELFETGIFAVKTSIGHEKMVANWLAIRARKRKMDVFAILSPPKLRGYLLLEGVKNKEALQDMIKGVQHARSVVDGTSSIEEIEHFLTPKPLVSGIEEGDVVEIIAGPFKGEKAKVTQIDESKEEITVELFEAMVSIPVTIRGDHVRILEKESK